MDLMQNDTRYTATTLSEEDALQHLSDTLHTLTGKNYIISARVAYLKLQIKDHKFPIKVRTVTVHENCGCREAEEHITRILTIIALDLDLSHVLNSTHNAHAVIPASTTHLTSFDVVGMFDNVLLDEAYHRIGAFIAAAYMRRPGFRINAAHQTAKWSKLVTPKSSHSYFNFDQALGLFKATLYCDYSKAAGTVYLSNKGVPMGGCSSTIIASLLCASIELIILPLAKLHYGSNLLYFRFVDDVISSLKSSEFLTLFQPHFQLAGMTYEESPPDADGGLPFLESKFYTSPTGVHAAHYCKRHTLFPRSTDLPHRGSALSRSAQEQLVMALAIRVYRSTSTIQLFTNALLTYCFRNRSYPRHLFQTAFCRVLTSNPTNKFNIAAPASHIAHQHLRRGTLMAI